jgi:thiamine biosynthesis lipoprotein
MIQVPIHVEEAVTARVRESVQWVSRGNYHQLVFRAMSTPARVCFVWERGEDEEGARAFGREVAAWVARFEARYSRFIPESVVGQINAGAGGGWMEVDEEMEGMLGLCGEMHRRTGGVFDAASLPLLRVWDWKAERVPGAEEVAAARAMCGWGKVERQAGAVRLPVRGMGIDLGGIGKEYAVDHVMEMARERGMRDVLVDIGQDIRVSGRSPGKEAWYIGLEEPGVEGRCWAVLGLTGQAVATSGDYRRSFVQGGRRYGHIVDGRSGVPVSNGCEAVTVVAPTCVVAGVMSTAAFVLGAEAGLELIRRQGNGVEGCITTESARYQTRRFSNYVPV